MHRRRECINIQYPPVFIFVHCNCKILCCQVQNILLFCNVIHIKLTAPYIKWQTEKMEISNTAIRSGFLFQRYSAFQQFLLTHNYSGFAPFSINRFPNCCKGAITCLHILIISDPHIILFPGRQTLYGFLYF